MRASRRRAAPTGRLARTIRGAAVALGAPVLAIGGLSLPPTTVAAAVAADESAGEPSDRPSSAGVLALDRPRVSEDANRVLFRMSADRVRHLEVVQDAAFTDDTKRNAPKADAPAVREVGVGGVELMTDLKLNPRLSPKLNLRVRLQP